MLYKHKERPLQSLNVQVSLRPYNIFFYFLKHTLSISNRK